MLYAKKRKGQEQEGRGKKNDTAQIPADYQTAAQGGEDFHVGAKACQIASNSLHPAF